MSKCLQTCAAFLTKRVATYSLLGHQANLDPRSVRVLYYLWHLSLPRAVSYLYLAGDVDP